jgi:arylformamidase
MITTTWIDISVPIYTGMVHWPDNPPVRVDYMLQMERGDMCTVSTLSMGSHTGTHMDGPLHFIQGGQGLHEMPLDAAIGLARVIEIADPESIKLAELQPYALQQGERLLFKTLNSSRSWQTATFLEDFVYLSQEAARYLASVGAQTVGIDYLSVGGFKKDGLETHQALLEAGIWIIEGLDLSQVEPGMYELICLPLKIADSDGAPARAILRKAGGDS